MNDPARPETLTVDLDEQPHALLVSTRGRSGPWVFLLLWLIGWTVGCVALAAGVVADPTAGMIVFALPFWSSWLLVAGFLVWMLFGKETLFVGQDEAVFRRTAIIQLTSRVIPIEEIQGFRECQSSHTENDKHLWGIEMVTLGKPVRFAFRLPDRERAWLVHHLDHFLKTIRPGVKNIPQPEAASSTMTARAEGPEATEVLAFARTLAEPPTDCRWHISEDYDSFAFRQKGRWSLAALAGLLFFNAFWNGVVAVFVMVLLGQMPGDAPEGWEWWGLFVFLIPFEGIGLAMFAVLVLTALEPWRHTQWRFETDHIVSQTRWLAYRRTKRWEVLTLDRLELRRSGSNDSRRGFTDLSNDTSFELVLVTRDNVDLCGIANLTEGEARWMARAILDHRRRWFR